jgi:uncharacterized membrane protein
MQTEGETRRPDDFEATPLTRGEYIQAMVHFYRGEIYRSNIWRQRLDNTTNWAVVTSAAVITFTFSEPGRTHLLLLLTNFVVLGFLWMEARRYRVFSVYRARVRMLEENFLLPIVTRSLDSPRPEWRELVAMDLDLPKYKTSFLSALALRVRNNYFWIFSTIYGAWLLRLWISPEPAHSLADMYAHAAVPPLPGWFLLFGGTAIYAAVAILTIAARRVPALMDEEFQGVEGEPVHWKR